MDIYVFGSLCRGEIDEFSDVDLLAITNSNDKNIDVLDEQKFSIYQDKRITNLWNEGNPFAWHLYLESKLIYSNNTVDLIQKLGRPRKYISMQRDLIKFHDLFSDSLNSMLKSTDSCIFDLSMIFLSIRNFASCYSLGYLKEYNFSRNSALTLSADKLDISMECFSILQNARILSTRGLGKSISELESQTVLKETDVITDWFQSIRNKI